MAEWKTFEGQRIENIYEEIQKEYNLAKDSNGLIIAYVGVDGQNLNAKWTSFVQCVALHKYDDCHQGKGGRVYMVKHLEKRYKNMQQKLLREVELAINLAQKLQPVFENLNIPFEVHLDVNSDPGDKMQNKSNSVHDASKGWAESNGFTVKTKPDAFVASIVADKHTKTMGQRKPRKFGKGKRNK